MSNALRLPEHDESSRFSPGQLVADRFAVVRFLDRGGMGEVYEVEDRHLQNVHVALKVIAPEIAADPAASRRFEQEVLLARRVTHPNLCPIYDIARSTGPGHVSLFLTMKLLGGETLGSRLARPVLIPPAQAISIFVQMAAGVGALHAAGVIHRDIKPGNVMLDSDGPDLCVSIMDFGLARLDDTETTMTSQSLVAGTPGYLAPELMLRQGPSQAADLFALGVVMHRVLAGERPYFNALTFCSRPTAALEQAEVPPLFIHTVKELLAEAPERRCAAFAALQAAIAAHASTGAWEPQVLPTVTAPRPISRRKFGVGAILAAGAAAGAAVGGLAWKHEQVYNLLHPLPQKRFVALLAWPPASSDAEPTVVTLLESIHNRLARVEANVKDVLVVFAGDFPSSPSHSGRDSSVSEWGANLILGASVRMTASRIFLLLQVVEAQTSCVLRSARISSDRADAASLPEGAAHAAAQLLGLEDQGSSAKETDQLASLPVTALASFTQAEQLALQPNNTGLDAAIVKYGECLNESPHFSLGYAKLAIAYTRKYRLFRDTAILTLARQNAEKASRNGLSPIGLLSRGIVALYSGDTQIALGYFAKALEADPGNPDVLLYRAQAFRDLGRWSEAEQAYRDILRERPNYWPANNELGWILFRQAKYQLAADAFDAAAMTAPTVAMPLANLGTMYIAQGKNSAARDASERSIKRSPNVTAYMNLGDLAFIDKDYKGALGDYLLAADLSPKNQGVWRDIADCYFMLGQPSLVQQNYKRAADLLAEALNDNPRSGAGWMTLAFYEAKAGDMLSANAKLARAEQLGASDTQSQFMKVQTLAVLGRREEALKLLLVCMDRGLSPVEVGLAVDLSAIRKDSRYIAHINSKPS